jgi:CheY-like chemotaxis protein
MRRLFFGALVLVLSASAVMACGDKLMLLSGMTRLRQVYSRAHPASILAYTRTNSVVPGVVRQLEHEPNLAQTGYKLSTVADPLKLDEALRIGKYDLILVDVADADSLAQQVRSAASMPLMLPIVYNSTKIEAKAVEKKFRCVLKAPASPDHYLAALDEALEIRLRKGGAKPTP